MRSTTCTSRSTRPSCRCSPSGSILPEGDGWIFEPKWDGFRVLVFRDSDECPPEPRREAAQPVLPRAPRTAPAAAPCTCCLDGEIVIARAAGSGFRGAADCACIPAASRVKMLAEQMPASMVFGTFSARATSTCAASRSAAARAARGDARPRRATHAPHPDDDRPRHRGRLVPSLRGCGARRGDGQASRGHVRAEQARDVQGEARARVRLRRGGLPVAQERRRDFGRVAASRSVRRRGDLQHVGVSASFTAEKRRELVAFLAPYRENALEGHRGVDWASPERARRAAHARRKEPVERWQRPVLAAAAP